MTYKSIQIAFTIMSSLNALPLQGAEQGVIKPEIEGSTAVYSLSDETIDARDIQYEQWVNFLRKSGVEILVSSNEGDFYISVSKVEKGCYVTHVHTLREDLEFSFFVNFSDDDHLVDVRLGKKGEINFHRILLNETMISEGVLMRLDPVKVPDKAVIDIKVKDGVRVIANLKLE